MATLSLSDPLKATLGDVTVDSRGESEPTRGSKKSSAAAAAERRSLVEVAAEGLFDIFGFEVGASASFDPLCEFVNPLLDEDKQLNCGERKKRRKA